MRSSDQHNYVGMTSEPKHDRINNPNTNEQEQIDPIKTQIQKAGLETNIWLREALMEKKR